jgi:hypothetical protein
MPIEPTAAEVAALADWVASAQRVIMGTINFRQIRLK